MTSYSTISVNHLLNVSINIKNKYKKFYLILIDENENLLKLN